MAKLYFYYSTMNAGKSTALLQAAHNYGERGMRTILYTARLDDRAAGRVASRIGISADALLYGESDDLHAWINREHRKKKIDCVFVDEAQFLTKPQVWQLARVADRLGIPVLCYGLRTDFQAQLFPGSGALLALADDLTELKTICHCGRKATMNVRLGADGKAVREGAQIEIGGNDRYVALCRKHFARAMTP